MHMGSMYATLNNVEKNFGKDGTILVIPYLGMAKALGSIGKETKAIEIYEHIITFLESCKGAESEHLFVPLLSLGNLLLKEGRVNDAESHFTSIYTKVYGENDGRIGMAMSSLAQVKCARGKSDEAIHLIKCALKVMTDSNFMSPDNSIMEKMRVDLAELLHTFGSLGKESWDMNTEEKIEVVDKKGMHCLKMGTIQLKLLYNAFDMD